MRTYGQKCGLACALDLLGERWTLLVIRELLLGDKRFRDLYAVLPGVSPTLLSERLHALAEAGVIERSEPRGWALTARGESLRPAVEALSVWGLSLLDPLDGQPARGSLLAASAAAAAGRVDAEPATIACDVDGDRFSVRLGDGRAHVRHGVPDEPDGEFSGTIEDLYRVLAGEQRPRDGAAARVMRALRLRVA